MMQSIQESKELLELVEKSQEKRDEDDRVYYNMEMAKVKAAHGIAYALLAVADALKKGGA